MGECKQCGKCCKVMPFYLETDDKKYLEYLCARGVEIKNGIILIPHVCEQLDENNKCKLHYTNKPEICKEFTGQSKYYIPEGCGYRENNKK